MKILFCIFLIIYAFNSTAQDSVYVRKTINTLTAKQFWGRGYTKDGMKKAAEFIGKEYRKIGLTPINQSYFQEFTMPVNTFPGRMSVNINGKTLIPGVDYIVNNESPTLKVTALLKKIDSLNYQATPSLKVTMKDKLTWSVASEVSKNTIIDISRKSVKEVPTTISVDIENKPIENFKAYNVVGMVKGTQYPDSVLLITAHYDHLGGMGENTYFPGANDNAAGVAMLLSLAKYYIKNPPNYSIGFICFGAEEAGLVGSRFFVENPMVPLSNIRFLLNLDLVGTGESGMTVVNASVYPKAFALLNEINDQKHLILKINARGKAANSDHYFFTEAGVPAFFIYTQGGPAFYHDVFDRSATLPLSEYHDLFKLLVDFNRQMMK
ncbi:M28 family metallopeptidase [Pedobacter sandarakinus]|uniref:M28 family metallopeptidase n=1 Tax=Pedobacter sandarakinus TaxID=353156 RepID=UPI00224564B8|nr:M28 family peptidase [Pedobacter sandarakinus]MCX2576081.1 M28 family peptidase [Pedobacter sandarakinus]